MFKWSPGSTKGNPVVFTLLTRRLTGSLASWNGKQNIQSNITDVALQTSKHCWFIDSGIAKLDGVNTFKNCSGKYVFQKTFYLGTIF